MHFISFVESASNRSKLSFDIVIRRVGIRRSRPDAELNGSTREAKC
jgi:hypothetical protein